MSFPPPGGDPKNLHVWEVVTFDEPSLVLLLFSPAKNLSFLLLLSPRQNSSDSRISILKKLPQNQAWDAKQLLFLFFYVGELLTNCEA